MLRSLIKPLGSSSSFKIPSTTTMLVTSHDVNFVMGFIKEDEIFVNDNNVRNCQTLIKITY